MRTDWCGAIWQCLCFPDGCKTRADGVFAAAGTPELCVLAHAFVARMGTGYKVSMKLRKPADRVMTCSAESLSTRIMGLPQSGQFQVDTGAP